MFQGNAKASDSQAEISKTMKTNHSDNTDEKYEEAQDLFMAVMHEAMPQNDISDTEDDVEDSSSDSKLKAAGNERKLGRKAFKEDEFEKATDHFQRAVKLNPEEISSYFGLAETKFKQGKYKECIRFCNKAVKVGKANKGRAKTVGASAGARISTLKGGDWR